MHFGVLCVYILGTISHTHVTMDSLSTDAKWWWELAMKAAHWVDPK